MAIQYSFSRVELFRDKVTNNVVKLVVGMTARDEETGVSSYIDTVHVLPEPIASLTNDEIREICLEVAQKNEWYSILYGQVQALINQPVPTEVTGI